MSNVTVGQGSQASTVNGYLPPEHAITAHLSVLKARAPVELLGWV